MAVTLELLRSGQGPFPQKSAQKSRAREGHKELPAPGSTREDKAAVVRKLADLLTSEDLEAAVEVWRDGMSANRLVWNAKLKMYVEAGPDWDVRRDCSELVAAYMEGKPMERQINISGSFVELGELINSLNASGEARRLLPGLQSLPFASDQQG